MPIRKQARATITISRMTTRARLFRLLAIRDALAKALALLRKSVAAATGAPFPESPLVNLACLPLRLDAHARPHSGDIPGFPRLDFRPS